MLFEEQFISYDQLLHSWLLPGILYTGSMLSSINSRACQYETASMHNCDCRTD